MAYGGIRFWYMGWIEKLYLKPSFFFKYYGFEWVKVLEPWAMYTLFFAIILSSLMIAVGLLYKPAAIVFFGTFTYSELIDASNYLNHYYLVCLFAFLLILLPANKAFSLDVKLGICDEMQKIPAWCINILIFQLVIVYTYAGLAKINYDWLINAMPMSVWLKERSSKQGLGIILGLPLVPYIFSWIGAIYDCSISFFLLNKFSRKVAYFAVVIFHLMTKLLFNIGLFPVIMIFSTLVFFPGKFHEKLLSKIGYQNKSKSNFQYRSFANCSLSIVVACFILLQIFLPMRHLAYNGDVKWTEEGYRFSWRVMLVEKNGLATFKVIDPESGRKSEIVNGNYLNRFQEKQMSIQADFILQFAHFLEREFQQKHGIKEPKVTVDSFVALNGRSSQEFIDSKVDLTEIKDGFQKKNWIKHLDL